MLRTATAAILLGLLLARPTAGAQVLRRGTEPAVEGRVAGIDDAGVTVRSESGAVHFIPWDRVREVVADTPPPGLHRWMPVAQDLWRARSRLERHDTTLAEPLLERLFQEYRGRTHETALVVAEGLLRCRLARGDHARAVIPALEVARLHRANVTTDSYSGLPPVLDAETSLCPVLAPAWVSARALARIERDLAGYDGQGDEVVSAIAALYGRAAAWALGSAAPLDEDVSLPEHPGVQWMQLLVQCGSPIGDEVQQARERLSRDLADRSGWREAWARFHVGRSLLQETGIGRRQRGMVSLLHLPARFGRDQPYLAGLALAHVAAALEESGDAEAASSLRLELVRRFPNHPVHQAGSGG